MTIYIGTIYDVYKECRFPLFTPIFSNNAQYHAMDISIQ